MKKANVTGRAESESGIPVRRRTGGLPRLLAESPAAMPVLLAFVIFLGFFYNLGGFPLFDVDEGAFSEATREMLERRDYLTTYLNGNLRFDKPILVYWLQAISVALLGPGEFAFRLPSALASVGWVAAILIFARQQADRATGFAAALIAATTLGLCVIGRAATADALLNLFLVLAMFDIYRYVEKPLAKYRYRAYLWMALGTLTKGPVALLIPFAVSAIAFALQGKFRLWRKAATDPIGWAILLVVAGPWYLLEYLEQGNAFIAGFFMRHNVERFMEPLQGHSGNVLYYLPAALALLLPYTGLFIRILPTVRKMRGKPLDTFLWSWFLFVLVFFTFAGTKLPHYLVYGISPLFVLMAMHRQALRSRWLAFVPPFLMLAFALALPGLLQFVGSHLGNAYFREMLTRLEVFGPSYYLASSILLAAMLAVAFMWRISVWQRLIAMGVLCSAAFGGLVLPAIGELQQGPVKEAAALARKIDAPVIAWRINVPSFSVYRNEVTKRVDSPGPGDVVLTRSDELRHLGRVDVLYRKGGIALVRIMS
jgi:4-amino-4-deoxy-L-arabinose transferase-like glycosyltransferase